MKKRIAGILFVIWAAGMAICGCGSEKDGDQGKTSSNTGEAVTEESKELTDGNEEKSADQSFEASENDKIASGDETVAAIEVVTDDMVPVSAEQIKAGEYEIEVASSSSMFKVVACHLQVKDNKMTAAITMSGTAYEKMFMGSASEAVNASEEQYITYEEDGEGRYVFRLPIEALDSGINCCAYSKNKEKWYDRVLVFKADSLPADAISGVYTTVEQLALDDGEYQATVVLAGGSGKASVTSPTAIKVENGKITATIIFSSPNYDYMIVDGTKYERVNTEGNSAFEIPVPGFDHPVAVIADTTAMSQPYEIEYTLTFDSSSIQ